jgi:1-pyrroline-5-carboxylate dehydrogenase
MGTITHANWDALDDNEFHHSFEAALEDSVEKLADGSAGFWIGGSFEERPEAALHAFSPADPEVDLGPVVEASDADIDRAVVLARAAGEHWRQRPMTERIGFLRALADVINRDRFEIAAEISLEIGKNRFEALTEVEEALKLISYYCSEMQAHDGFRVHFPALGSEENESVMRPYGVFAILGPVNFPFALTCGMASAALLCGNTVISKPPDAAPIAGRRFGRVANDASLPPGVVQVLTGGPEVGRQLTNHPHIDGVAFVGSLRVGQLLERQLAGKPFIAEMGGKNPAIVMESADIDVAAEAITRSAFRYAGQKCSASSRAYVSSELVDELADGVAARMDRMTIGIPWQRETIIGPLINEAALARYHAALDAAQDEGAQVRQSRLPDALPDGAAYAAPAIITGLPSDHELLQTELFAPVLCIQPVASIGEAVREANRVPFGLTAGLYSRDQSEIERFLDTIEAGVVYVNRKTGATTGAWVGHQSFGGWKGSGSTGFNAHGPYYLAQFMREQSRTVETDA